MISQKSFTAGLLTLLTLGLVSTHFTLDYPLTRGFSEDDEPKFCGGFPTNATGRHPFPLSGPAPILINSHHSSAEVAIIIAFKSDPTTFADFNTSNKVTFLRPFGRIEGRGPLCFNIDINSLASQVPNITDGTLATLQVEYNGGDSPLFQCSDLILQKNYTTPSNVTCVNGTSSSSQNSIPNGASQPKAGANSSANALVNQNIIVSVMIFVAMCIALA
ncbi:hypothetical protein O181_014800 [Austropuccinia psidii MF-1]|uniref:Copper acquisition factor BIM1-like domain-containing protein n=1 Tax=Austropuccinia psidii MF-1 TaxID=1389203 RepID=A0A9Q3C1N0_9BASI|nr:hypothetical protein [Austropuccinia psidii MF-1]